MKRRTIIYVIMLFVAVSTVNAQSVTYIHENDIMNQFLTMETGRACQNSLILKKSQSPDFHKPGLCYV